MANELQFDYGQTGLPATGAGSLYAVARNAAGQYVYANGSVIEAYNAAHWTNYQITLTEVGATGIYVGTFPVVAAGNYSITYRLQAGASAVPSPATDIRVGVQSLVWSGTAEVVQSGDAYAAIESLGAGSGAYTVTITVTDASANPLQGANVRVTLNSLTLILATNSGGQVTFNLNSGTYTVAIALASYVFSGASLVVAANVTRTYTMAAQAITPSPAGETTGYLVCYSNAGVAVQNVTVTAMAIDADATTGLAQDTATRTVSSDSNGLVQFTGMLIGVRYAIRRGNGPVKYVTIPATAGTTYSLQGIVGTP